MFHSLSAARARFVGPGLTLALLLAVAPAHAGAAQGARLIPGHYIVVVKGGHDPADVVKQAAAHPSHVYRAALNGFAAELTDTEVALLRKNPDVDYVEQDQLVTAEDNPTQTMDAFGDPWGLDAIDQLSGLDGSYHYQSPGQGVTAYVIDTGIQTSHPDFGGRAVDVFDAFGGNGQDCYGHGTHVAGTIGGTIYGVAKSVQLRGVRVLDCTGTGSYSGVIAGINWVTANAQKPAVANMSLGGGLSSAVNTAVTNMSNAGIFVAVAAGNSNTNACNVSPASAAGAYTVAAFDRTSTRASFSNYGSCVQDYAPGVSIKSDYLNGGTAWMSGTSMATPHVTGAAAQIKIYWGDISSSHMAGVLNEWADSPGVINANPAGTPNRRLYTHGVL